MAYKKYIKKNGKVYGPYVYHSKRVDGKVISEYHGIEKERKWKNFIPIFIAALFVFGAMGFLVLHKQKVSGNAILNLKGNLVNGTLENGKINLTLKAGELIPANSKIIIQNNGTSYEYTLNTVINSQNTNTSKGNFYIENSHLSGAGEGYGIPGKAVIFPQISFNFTLTSSLVPTNTSNSSPQNTSNNSNSSGQTTIPTPAKNTNSSKTTSQNKTFSNTTPTNSTASNTTSLSNSNISNASTKSNTTKTNQSLTNSTVQISTTSSSTNTTNSQNTTSSNPATTSSKNKQTNNNNNSSNSPSSKSSSNNSTKTNSTSSSITGNAVKDIFGGISQVITGFVSQNSTKTYSGITSKSKSFEYQTNGKTLNIIPESIISQGKNLSSKALKVTTQQNKTIISTNYNLTEYGFGKNYTSESFQSLIIDLSKLNLTNLQGEVKIRLEYNNTNLATFSENLSSMNPLKNLIQNTSNNSNNSIPQTLNFQTNLTQKEKDILLSNLNTNTVKTAVSNYKNKYLVDFNIGTYSSEYSYPSNLTKYQLDSYIQRDRYLWLMDIINQFQESTPQKTLNSNLSANYTF